MKINNSILYSLIIFLIIFLLHYYFNTRGYFILISLFLIFFILNLNFDNTPPKNVFYSSIIFCSILFIGTVNELFNNGFDISIYQIFRSQGWILVTIILFYKLDTFFKFSSLEFYENVLYLFNIIIRLFFIVYIFDYFFKFPILPSVIRINEYSINERIYIYFNEVIPVFSLVYFIKKNYLTFLILFIFTFITVGKANIILFIFTTLFSIIYLQKSRINIFLTTLITFLFFAKIFDRLTLFINNGDLRRLGQIKDAFNKFTSSTINFLFGSGIGTPYSKGYFALSNNYIINGKDSSSLFENSRFDVENGYLFLLLRFGIIGTIFFYFILKKYFHGIYFNFIIFYLLIFFASIGLSGISFFTLIFSFLFLKYFLLKSNYGFA